MSVSIAHKKLKKLNTVIISIFEFLGFPFILYSLAYLAICLALLGAVKPPNAGAISLVAGGILPAILAVYYYVKGLPLLIAEEALGVVLLKVATIAIIFATAFLLAGFTLLGMFGGALEAPPTGVYVLVIGLLGVLFGYAVATKFLVPGIAVVLFGLVAIILGSAIGSQKGVTAAAGFSLFIVLILFALSIGLQLGYFG